MSDIRKYGERHIFADELLATRHDDVMRWLCYRLERAADREGRTLDRSTVVTRATPFVPPPPFEPWWRRMLIRLRLASPRKTATHMTVVEVMGRSAR